MRGISSYCIASSLLASLVKNCFPLFSPRFHHQSSQEFFIISISGSRRRVSGTSLSAEKRKVVKPADWKLKRLKTNIPSNISIDLDSSVSEGNCDWLQNAALVSGVVIERQNDKLLVEIRHTLKRSDNPSVNHLINELLGDDDLWKHKRHRIVCTQKPRLSELVINIYFLVQYKVLPVSCQLLRLLFLEMKYLVYLCRLDKTVPILGISPGLLMNYLREEIFCSDHLQQAVRTK